MSFARIALICCALALCACATRAQSPAPAPQQMTIDSARIDAVFADLGADEPGCVLGLMRPDAIVYTGSYGRADLASGAPLTPDTMFELASSSKQFAALAIAQLAARGALSLEDDVRAYVPELPDYGAPIRIRHLLHHTSGLRDYLDLFALRGQWGPKADFSLNDTLALLAQQKALEFKTGSRFAYSNTNYVLLAVIVERVAGKPLSAYAREKIFAPLGMTHSLFLDDMDVAVPARAEGYEIGEDGGPIKEGTRLEIVGDGGVWSSVRELYAYQRDFYEGRVVWTDAVREIMLRPGALDTGGGAELDLLPDGFDYAGGLATGRIRGQDVVFHGGSFAGYRSQTLFFPALRASIIVLCNRRDVEPLDRTLQIAEIVFPDLMGPDKGALPAFRMPGQPETPGPPAARARLDALAGAYKSAELGVAYSVAVQEGRLRILAVGGAAPVVDAAIVDVRDSAKPDVLMLPERRSLLVERDARGRVRAFTWRLRHDDPGLRFVRE